MVVFTDKRINQCINDSVQYYRADLRSAYDYYPFGMLIPDRTFDSVAYVQLPDRVDTTINQRIKIQIPTLNPGQIISLSKDGETYVLAQYQSGYTGAQYSAIIAGSAIVNELSFEDSAGYLIIENTTLGGQSICSGIPSFSINIAGTNYVVNCSQSIDTIRGGLLSEAGYLFGFNGMEKENERSGVGNGYTAEFRQYDPRLGFWFSLDPAIRKYPEQSPYLAFNCNPIFFSDPYGDEPPEKLGLGKKVANWFKGNAWKNRADKFIRENNIDEQQIKYHEDRVEIDLSYFSASHAGFSEAGESMFAFTLNEGKAVFGNGERIEGDFLGLVLNTSMKTVNAAVGAASTYMVYKGGYHKWNEIWHQTKTNGTAFRWQSKRWNNPGAVYHRGNQVARVQNARNLSTKLTKLGGALLVADIALSGEVKPSHAINAAMLAASTTGVGSIIAGVWFLADFGTMGVNYLISGEAKGLGDIIDESVGTSIELYEGVY